MPVRQKRPDALLEGARVYIRAPRPEDRAEFIALTHDSRRLHRGLVAPPEDDAAFDSYLERCTRPNFVGLLLCRLEDGRVVGVFPSKVEPSDPALIKRISALLAEPAPH